MPCDSDEVRPDDACAMMSFRPVFDGPAKGVAVHVNPALDGVLPPIWGDFGVRGVIAPGVDDCCGRRVGDVMDLPLASSHPSSIGDSEGIGPSFGVDIGLIAGEGPGERYCEPISSSMVNIISLVEALVFNDG
jgi:hypothetical protein